MMWLVGILVQRTLCLLYLHTSTASGSKHLPSNFDVPPQETVDMVKFNELLYRLKAWSSLEFSPNA